MTLLLSLALAGPPLTWEQLRIDPVDVPSIGSGTVSVELDRKPSVLVIDSATTRAKGRPTLVAVKQTLLVEDVLHVLGQLKEPNVHHIVTVETEETLGLLPLGPSPTYQHIKRGTAWGDIDLTDGWPRIQPATMHHSEMEAKKRVTPHYPSRAEELGIPADQGRCRARVFIDQEGTPYDVIVSSCHQVFHQTTKETLLQWEWYPPGGKTPKAAVTTVGVVYVRR